MDGINKAEFTPEEELKLAEVANGIDLTSSASILQFGAGAQKKVADFSEDALKSVRGKDLGEVGDLLSTMVSELKSFDADEEQKKGLFGFFKKSGKSLSSFKAKYNKVETNVDHVCTVLEDHQMLLMKDVATLDKMYEVNLNHFKELSLYIAAGTRRLDEATKTELPAMKKKAEESGRPEDAQAANDFASLCGRFEKKIYDLNLTKTIALQMAPQIRLVQQNDTLMSEKIQSTLVNTIPLWKSQMLLALGVNHSLQAAKAQREVTDMTNAMLKSNAEKIKQTTIETARESERGIVDIETLQQTNATLISSLDEVLVIQNEGHAKRQAAETELAKIENELKEKLLEFKN